MFNKIFNSNSRSITTLVILAILSLVVSCAPKPKKSETKLNLVSGMAIADINMDGGAIVYGQQQDGPGSWAKIFRPGDDVVVDMAFGVWNFSVIAYAGPIPLDGTKECAVVNNVNIASENEVIDVVVNGSNCFAAGMRNLKVVRCSDAEFNSGDPVATCSQLTGFESYRLRLLSHRVGTLTGDRLTSKCYQESTFGGAGAPVVPMGITNISTMPFEVIGYTGVSCDTDPVVVSFPVSLSQPKSTSLKSFWSGPSLTLAINNDGPGLDATPPALTIVPTSAVNSAGKNWINSGTVTSFTVTGTCEAGPNVNFELNAVSMGISTTCPSGTFSHTFDFSGYPEDATNALNLAAKQIDTAGNVGVAQTALYKDTTAPTSGSVTSFTPTPNGANYINVTNPTVSFSKGSDGTGSSGKTYELFRYGTTACTGPRTSQTINEPATNFILSLTDGSTNSFKVRAIDHAGNTSADSTCFASPLFVDTTAPAAATAVVLTPTNPTNDTTPNYTWTLSVAPDIASQEVEIYNGSCGTLQETITGLTNTDTSVNLTTRTEGTWSIRVATIDNAGNRTLSACSPNVIIDTTLPPNPVVTSFTGSSPSNAIQVTVNFNESVDLPSGTKEYQVGFYNDGICTSAIETVTVPDVGATTFSATTSTLSAGTNDGTYKVKIVTVDNAGNTRTSPCSTVNIVRDTTPPAPPTLGAPNWATTSPTFSKNVTTNTWSLSGDTSTINIDVFDGSGCTGNNLVNQIGLSSTTTSRYFNLDSAGPRYYRVTAIDTAGNSSNTCSTMLEIKQGSMGIGGDYIDGFVVGNTHLYALTNAGLEIYDVSVLEPAQMTLVGKLKIPGIEPKVARKYGSFIYIFEPTGGIVHVFNTTGAGTLNNPIPVGKMNGGTSPADRKLITSSPGYIWVATATGNISGIDISTPGTTGTNVGPFASGASGCTSITYEGTSGYLYLSCGQNIVPIDISTPSSPVNHPGIDPDGVNAAVYEHIIAGGPNTLYAGGDGGGIQFSEIDVSSPTAPAMTKTTSTTGTFPITSLGNFNPTNSFVSSCTNESSDKGVVFDGTTGGLVKRAQIDSGSTTCNLALSNDNEAFTLSRTGGLRRDNVVSGISDSTPLMPGTPLNLSVAPNGLAAVATRLTEGFTIYDLADKWNPKVKTEDISITAANAAFGNNNVLIASGVTLKRYPVSYAPLTFTPTPVNIGLSRGVNNTTGMAIAHTKGADGYVYIGHTDGFMSVVDVSNDNKKYDMQACNNTAQSVVDITVDPDNENRVYTLCADGEVRGFDNSNPDSTFTSITGVLGNFVLPVDTNPYEAIALKGGALYVSNNNSGTRVYNVSSVPGTIPTSPTMTLTGNTAQDVVVRGNFLYVSILQGGVKSWNVTTPLSPSSLGTVTAPGTPGAYSSTDFSEAGATPDALYQATYLEGIQVINIQDPAFMHQ